MRGLENFHKAVYSGDNRFDFPELTAYKYTAELGEDIKTAHWIDFDSARTYISANNNALHFYVDDYKFQCIWNMPDRYINFLKRFDYVVMPDFSLYYDYPVALQIYNKYRNHWLFNYFGENGVNLIPNVSLSTPDNYIWSLMGYPKHSVVAYSDIGTSKFIECKGISESAVTAMVEELEPEKVIYFTRSANNVPDGDIYMPVVLPYRKKDSVIYGTGEKKEKKAR